MKKRNSLYFVPLLFSATLFSQNTGIGTTTPRSKLEVVGGARAAKGHPAQNDFSNAGYTFEGDGDTGVFAVGGNSDANSDIVLYNDALPIMYLKSGGKVGIGTDNPGEKLQVAGNIKADTFIASTNAYFPDYVFEKYYNNYSKLNPGYQFYNLKTVEKYIKTEGHLPGFPAAKEVEKNKSIDITKTQLVSVEKIEELYLHLIKQQKDIDAQEQRIKYLEEKLQQLENSQPK